MTLFLPSFPTNIRSNLMLLAYETPGMYAEITTNTGPQRQKTSRVIAAGHSASISVKGFVAEVPPRSELRAHSCGDGYV